MKRFFKISGIVIVCLVAALGGLFALLNNSRVQTAIVSMVTDALSERFSAQMSIGRVDYDIPNHIHLDSIYLADRQGDTLLFVEHAVADFRMIDFLRKRVTFRRIELRHSQVNLCRYNDEETNIDFLLELFKTDKQKDTPTSILQVKDVWVNGMTFSYRNLEALTADNTPGNTAQFNKDDIFVDSLNVLLSLNYFSPDSIDAEIRHFFVHEKSGLQVNTIEAHFIMTEAEAYMPKMHIALPRSDIATSVVHAYFPEEKSEGNIGRTATTLRIDNASLVMRDLAPLIPALGKIDDPLIFSANVWGTVDSLRADNMLVRYRGQTIVNGDMRMAGLPNLDSTYFRAQLQDFHLSYTLVQDLLSDMRDYPVEAPDMMQRLGSLHYRGQLAGRMDSMSLKGAFTSRLGSISTTGLLRTRRMSERLETISDTTYRQIDFRNTAFRGRLETKSFELGKLLSEPQLGSLSADIEVDGYTSSDKEPLYGDIAAHIDHLGFRGHNYQNIRLDGTYNTHGADCTLSVSEEDLDVQFSGQVNLRKNKPTLQADLDLRRIHLDRLHLTDKLRDSDLRFRSHIDLCANHIDDIEGSVAIDTLTLINEGKRLHLKRLLLTATPPTTKEPRNGYREIKLQSDFVNASLAGSYRFKTLRNTAMAIANTYLPSLVEYDNSTDLRRQPNDAEFYLYARDMNTITDVLGIDLKTKNSITLKGSIDESRNSMSLQAVAPEVKFNGRHLKNIALDMQSDRQEAGVILRLDNIADKSDPRSKAKDMTLRLDVATANDAIALDAHWLNEDTTTKGTLSTLTKVDLYKHKPRFSMQIMPTEVQLQDTIWNIERSALDFSTADTTLTIHSLQLGSDYQRIEVMGVASKSDYDSLYVKLQKIDLDYLLHFTKIYDVIHFSGKIDGWAKVYSVFSSPMFEADARIDSAHINYALLGDAHATATLDKVGKRVVIDGNVEENHHRVAHVDGEVIPARRYWGLDIDVDSANLAFLNYWTKKFLYDVQGRGYGHFKVFGEQSDTYVVGKPYGKDASFGIAVLGTRYSFSDTVVLDSSAIVFNHITAYDERRQPIIVDGRANHHNFKNFEYGIDLDVSNAHAISLSPSSDGMFYGDVYATGTVNISGDNNRCDIMVDAVTEPNTDFSLSIAKADNAKDDSFVEFVSDEPEQPKQTAIKVTVPRKTDSESVLNLQLLLDATDDANINVIINRNGDMLKAKGNGAMRIDYDSRSAAARILGTYAISSGSFGLTIENIIHRSFTFQEGSEIIFNGSPSNPQIDATAIYSTTASLKDLFGTDYSQVATTRSSIPVNCLLYLRGNLSNPTISFGIELPQSDETVASQVKSIINTDEMLMREIIYLLAFNRFYTPDYMQSNTTVGLGETYSLLTSTLTGQINNWLSKLTNNFTVGFNIRTDGEGSSASQEYETQIQLQPTNRLLINGNLGYRHNDISNRPVFGNLDIEYMLTPSGHWRAKAYTHTVDKYSLRDAITVQGLGFKYQQDFNRGDAKKQKALRQKQREEKKAEKEKNKGKQEKKTNTNRNLHKSSKRS